MVFDPNRTDKIYNPWASCKILRHIFFKRKKKET